MRSPSLRLWLVAMLAVAAVLSVAANKLRSPFLSWIVLAIFLCAVVVFLHWRRTVVAERHDRVFDQEAKTDEARARPDQ